MTKRFDISLKIEYSTKRMTLTFVIDYRSQER